MRELASYVMRGRRQAIIVALLFTLIPFLGWVSDVIVVLVTLRKGAKEGGIVLLWMILPTAVLAIVGYPDLWWYDIIAGSLVTYLLALVLRETNSWAWVLQVGMVFGLIGVMLVHLWVPNVPQLLSKGLVGYLLGMEKYFGLEVDVASTQQLAQQIAKYALGLQATLMLLVDLFNVVIARWWQSMLYNPQGLSTELRTIRLSSLAIGLVVLALVGGIAGLSFMQDSLPVLILPFVLAGLSLMHYLARFAKVSNYWLIGFYVLLILFFPYLAAALVLAAVVDCWLNLRQRCHLYNNS